MLNINKIDSEFNKRNLYVTDIAKILSQPYTTVVHKKKKGNWTPDDVERIADYFNKSILYFFDRDTELAIVSEPKITYYNCTDCIKKQKEIDELKEYRQKYIECLEEIAGKKKAAS
jgi:hypothetical protein